MKKAFTPGVAEVYHVKLCLSILVGFEHQRKDGMYKHGFVGLLEAGQEQEDLLRYPPMSSL